MVTLRTASLALAGGLLFAAVAHAGAATAPATSPTDVPGSFENRLNDGWVLLASLPVYLMHGGFGFFEAGMTRRKSAVATLTHNLMVLAVTVMVFWLVGFGLMFGDGPGWVGLHGFAPSLMLDPDPRFPMLGGRPVALVVAFAFALSYADTPATLIAGSCAERLKLPGFMIITALVSGVLFPVLARWSIGGGFLATRAAPVYDTGSGFIQLCGGCLALGTCVVLGPRRGRFGPGGEVCTIPSHSLPLVFLGAFILWMGFLSFNIAFAMVVGRSSGLVLVNTVLGSMAGACAGLLGVWLHEGLPSLRATMMSMLTACVAITSGAGVMAPWAAVVTGLAVGLVAPFAIALWPKLRIDDPTEYLTMNVVGGAMGMVAVGVFASPAIVTQYGAAPVPAPGLIYGHAAQLVTQSLAVAVTVVFSTGAGLTIALALRAAKLLRVEPDAEDEGDESEHGEEAYPSVPPLRDPPPEPVESVG